MNDYSFLLISTLILLGSLGCAQINKANTDLAPSKALIILTRESWGCLNGQDVKEDVSTLIAQDDGNFATIQEIKNPEDVFNRYELYLIFPAKPVNGLAGNFVVKFWCNNDQPETVAYLSIDYAKLHIEKGGNSVLAVKIKGNGFIYAKMLYSRNPEIQQAWFSCPEAGLQQPQQLTFFTVYPLEGSFGGAPQQKLNGQWQKFELTFSPLFSEGAAAVDKCHAFLTMLDEQFALPNRPLVWDREEIKAETFRVSAKQAVQLSEGETFQVLLKSDDGFEIHIGSKNFVPHLRQKLALKNPDGSLVGAELWLRIER